MKTKNVFFFSALWISTMGLHSNESTVKTSSRPPLAFEKTPNCFYFGPEFFGFNLKTHVEDIQIHGNKFFWGIGFGYEHLKPRAVYAGIDLLTSYGTNTFHASKNGRSLCPKHDDTWFGSSELRLGYTFAPQKWLCSPFLGLGGYLVEGLFHTHANFQERFSYIVGGVRTIYEHSSVFNAGLNLKIFRSYYAIKHYYLSNGCKSTAHPQIWGGELGIPLVWHIGSKKHWDVEVEPYFLQLDFSETQNVYGTRLLFGYHF